MSEQTTHLEQQPQLQLSQLPEQQQQVLQDDRQLEPPQQMQNQQLHEEQQQRQDSQELEPPQQLQEQQLEKQHQDRQQLQEEQQELGQEEERSSCGPPRGEDAAPPRERQNTLENVAKIVRVRSVEVPFSVCNSGSKAT
jgi:hypothetical protein